MFAGTAFELVWDNRPSRPENISPCISFCAISINIFCFYYVIIMFLLCLLFYRKENIATPSTNQFVFVNEVLNKYYINISDKVTNKSVVDTFCTQISP